MIFQYISHKISIHLVSNYSILFFVLILTMNFKTLIAAFGVCSVLAQDPETVYSTISHSVTINEPGLLTSFSSLTPTPTEITSLASAQESSSRYTSYLTTTSTYQSVESHEPTYTSTVYLTSVYSHSTPTSAPPSTSDPLTITYTSTVTSVLSSSMATASTFRHLQLNSTSPTPLFNSSSNFTQTAPTTISTNGATSLSMSLSIFIVLVALLF